MPKAILMDLGNVLVFYDPLRVARYLSHDLLRLPLEQVNDTLTGPKGLALSQSFETGQISGEGYVTGLEELFQAPLIRSEFWSSHLNIVSVNTPIVEKLRSIAAPFVIRLVVITDVDVMRLDDALAKCKLPFHGVAASCRVGVRKPHPWMYETALAIADVPARDCFFVDGMEENVRAAEKMGIRSRLYVEPEPLIAALHEFLQTA